MTLSLEPDGIRIVPAELDQEAIENLALRYLLRTVGDGVFIEAKPTARVVEEILHAKVEPLANFRPRFSNLLE